MDDRTQGGTDEDIEERMQGEESIQVKGTGEEGAEKRKKSSVTLFRLKTKLLFP